jgi:hypothetical protein
MFNIVKWLVYVCNTRFAGQDSVVSTVTRYGLDSPRIASHQRRDFRTCPDRSWGRPSLLYNRYRVSFTEVKRPGRGIDQHPHVTPRLKKSRAIPLLTLWAFMSYYKVNFTLLPDLLIKITWLCPRSKFRLQHMCHKILTINSDYFHYTTVTGLSF